MRIELSTTINRPIDEVFTFLSDPNRHAEWVESVLSDEMRPGETSLEGGHFHEEVLRYDARQPPHIDMPPPVYEPSYICTQR